MPELIALGILAVVIVLFLTDWIPSAVTAVLGCVLFALSGICTVAEAFSGFSNEIVILVFGMLVVGEALFSSGLAMDIGKQVLRISHNSERMLILVAGGISAVLSSFLSNVAVIAMMLAVLRSAVMVSPNIRFMNVCMPVTMGAMFGGACTLVGSTPQLTMQSILSEATGLQFGMFDFLYVGAPLTILYLVYSVTIGYSLAGKVWGGREETLAPDGEAEGGRALAQGSRRQKITMVFIFFGMIILFITELIPIALTSAVAAIACIVTRCATQNQVVRNMNWPVVIRLAGCLGIAKGLTASGSGELIATGFIGLFGDQISPPLLLAAATALTLILSNFISNSTAVFIVLPPVLGIAVHLGLSPLPFAMAASYASALTFATPLANAQIGLSMMAGYQFSDYVKVNTLLEVLVLVLIVGLTPLCFPF